jgi:hypothetical protein
MIAYRIDDSVDRTGQIFSEPDNLLAAGLAGHGDPISQVLTHLYGIACCQQMFETVQQQVGLT